jgi:hypothetical protein
MAEFMPALRTLKALQAEQPAAVDASAAYPMRVRRLATNEPERLMEIVLPKTAIAGGALHEPASPAPRLASRPRRTNPRADR